MFTLQIFLLLLRCLCILFTFILVVSFMDFCLLVYHFFMLVFVIILCSTIICKQVCSLHSYVFVAFVYNFNVNRCRSKIPTNIFFISGMEIVFKNFKIFIWWQTKLLTNKSTKLQRVSGESNAIYRAAQ